MERVCEYCREHLPPTARFCTACGRRSIPLPPTQADPAWARARATEHAQGGAGPFRPDVEGRPRAYWHDRIDGSDVWTIPGDWREFNPRCEAALQWVKTWEATGFAGSSDPRSEQECWAELHGAASFLRELPADARPASVFDELRRIGVQYSNSKLDKLLEKPMKVDFADGVLSQAVTKSRARIIDLALGPPPSIEPGDATYDWRLVEVVVAAALPTSTWTLDTADGDIARCLVERRQELETELMDLPRWAVAAMAQGLIGIGQVDKHRWRAKTGVVTPEVRQAMNLSIGRWNDGVAQLHYLAYRQSWPLLISAVAQSALRPC